MKISKWYKWYFDESTNVLRRYRIAAGKRIWETYPSAKWKHLSETELQSLLRRLNATHEALEKASIAKLNYDHSYINAASIAKFEAQLDAQAEDREYKRTFISNLHRYPFHYFLQIAKIADPGQWPKHEHGFNKWLLGQDLSASSLKRITFNANRFLRFIHKLWPDQVPLVELAPIGKLALPKSQEREKFIAEEKFNLMCEHIDVRLLALVKLSYYFGLRLAEALALTQDDVLEGGLDIVRQIKSMSKFQGVKAPKGGKLREVPYYFCTPDLAYELAGEIVAMHPDTAGHLFTSEMKKLGLPFKHHDFRRTFITRLARLKGLREAQLAAGHSDSRTTDRYMQDDRRLSRAKFIPKKTVVKVVKD